MRHDAIQNNWIAEYLYLQIKTELLAQLYRPGTLYSHMLFYKGNLKIFCLVYVGMAEQREVVPTIILIASATSSFSTISITLLEFVASALAIISVPA